MVNKNPGICRALDVFGYASIAIGALIGVLELFNATTLSWTEILTAVLCGVVLLGFAAGIRALIRIEHAVLAARFEHVVAGEKPPIDHGYADLVRRTRREAGLGSA